MKYIATKPISIIDALAILSPKSSKTTLKSWIKEGRITVDDGVIQQTSFLVETNQCVAVGQRTKVIRSKISILYEDTDLVIIDKPSGLLSVSTAFEKKETAFALLKAHYQPRKVFVVHRLDEDTSGVMVFALNENTLEKLKELFAVHEIERAYTAIVEGHFKQSSGSWKSYQYEDKFYKIHETDDQTKGKLAVTHFSCINTSKAYSRLELKLETGRKNQIRVHCQSAGHPIVGDKKYGAQTNPIRRVCLHAHLLAFQHPTTKKKLRFQSAPPEDFNKLIRE